MMDVFGITLNKIQEHLTSINDGLFLTMTTELSRLERASSLIKIIVTVLSSTMIVSFQMG